MGLNIFTPAKGLFLSFCLTLPAILGGLCGAGKQGQCFSVGDPAAFRRSEGNKRSESYGMRLRGAQEKAARRGLGRKRQRNTCLSNRL